MTIFFNEGFGPNHLGYLFDLICEESFNIVCWIYLFIIEIRGFMIIPFFRHLKRDIDHDRDQKSQNFLNYCWIGEKIFWEKLDTLNCHFDQFLLFFDGCTNTVFNCLYVGWHMSSKFLGAGLLDSKELRDQLSIVSDLMEVQLRT